MKEYQKEYDFFLWDMMIQQSKVQIAFYPIFGYIIGDNEGHDKLVGRFLNRMNVQRLCRYCDTPLEQSDNPFYSTHGTGRARAGKNRNKNGLTLGDPFILFPFSQTCTNRCRRSSTIEGN
jgi:hypothetical protein